MADLWARRIECWTVRWLASSAAPVTMPGIAAPPPQLVCADTSPGGGSVWALLAPRESRILVNGRLIRTGICVLADRDEIRAGDAHRFFFSAESPAVVVPFPVGDRAVYCARCREAIAQGTPAVACPGAGCGLWYHHDPDAGRPCFEYSKKCNFCPARTRLNTAFEWTPEEEEL